MGKFYKGIRLPNESKNKLLKVSEDYSVQATDTPSEDVSGLEVRVSALEDATTLISEQLEDINGEVV